MSAKVKRIDMCNGPIFLNAIKYTIPIIFSALLQLFFNAADLIVVGRFCGSNSVAAVGATGSLINLIVNFFMGMASGVSVVVSNTIGAGNKNDTKRAVHTIVPLGFIAGAILTVVGVLFSTPILKLMSTPSDILPLSSIYTRIYFCGMIPSFSFEFIASIFRSAGDTKTPMKYLSLAGLINIVLNVFFVTVFNMDVAGVALATVIAQVVSFFLILRALMKREDECKFEISKMRIHINPFKKILAIGFPAGIQSSIFAVSNVIIQSSVNGFGATVVAGNSAAQNIEGFVYAAMHAHYHTSINFTGQNMGAGKFDRILRSIGACLISVFVVGFTLGTLCRIFAPNLLSIYITDNPDAILYGIKRMSYIGQFYFLCGIMEVFTGAIRGMGASLTSLFISVIGVCGMRLGWIFTVFRIPQFHTLDSLYFSYIISWSACIIAQIIAFSIIYRKYKKKIIKE